MKRFELMPGERILSSEGIHWKNQLSSAALALLALGAAAWRFTHRGATLLSGLPISAETSARLLSGALLLEGLALLLLFMTALLRMVRNAYIRYYLTDRRIVRVSGIVTVSVSDMLLSRVEMVLLNQNLYERLFNCGDIRCVSAGAELFLDDVRNARGFKASVMSLIENR